MWQGLTRVFLFVLVCGSAMANQQSFEQWRDEVRQEALEQGISPQTFERAFRDVAPIPRIVELDRKQPEFTLTLEEYVSRVVPQRRISLGKKKLAENRALLEQVAAEYGVQPRFLVAFWGIETDFGRLTGGFSVIAALTTLAYDGRRAEFFRDQLLDALQILEQGHIEPDQMTGSWAGAMGQAQFMPSTFRAYAVDFDGDNKIDLWRSKADVFASAANYLAEVGWDNDQTWGREVKLPEGFDTSLLGLETKKPLDEWDKLGVRRLSGNNLPDRNLMASLVQPDEGKFVRTYLVYDNYRAILDWNRSHKFAVAVGTLADAIGR
ncbi:lytic transglycosylase [Candidatus Tenderia electrophaga]|jgi:membrane-bound lytic murein transglycosylase B|uniref:Lytic transglycosylase n=1 Tax=Candidatus Tenderia electrophaga TaxID=1748243 RepID=A0A0S2TD24_9GAMM|nr:lytic transglycosylase [Candidatus Tenderia electrophaga]